MDVIEDCLVCSPCASPFVEPLGVIDHLTGHVGVSGVYYFPFDPDLARMRESLFEALSAYPMVAGSLFCDEGWCYLDYRGPGVGFSSYSSDQQFCDIFGIGGAAEPLDYVDPPVRVQDVFSGRYPLLSFRVTRFKGGGFALGVRNVHSLMDGVALGHFLSAWSACYGGIRPRGPSTFDRCMLDGLGSGAGRQPSTMFPLMPPANFKVRSVLERSRLHSGSTWIRISSVNCMDLVERVRSLADRSVTLSDILHALVWKSAAASQGYPVGPDFKVYTVFDLRRVPDLNIPGLFFGNAFSEQCLSLSLQELMNRPLHEVSLLFRRQLKPLRMSSIRKDIAFLRRERLKGRIDNETGCFTGFMRRSIVDCLDGSGVYVNDMRSIRKDFSLFGGLVHGFELIPTMGWPFAGIYSLPDGGVSLRYVGYRGGIDGFVNHFMQSLDENDIDIERAFIALSSP